MLMFRHIRNVPTDPVNPAKAGINGIHQLNRTFVVGGGFCRQDENRGTY